MLITNYEKYLCAYPKLHLIFVNVTRLSNHNLSCDKFFLLSF